MSVTLTVVNVFGKTHVLRDGFIIKDNDCV